jgi:hypothetical protein
MTPTCLSVAGEGGLDVKAQSDRVTLELQAAYAAGKAAAAFDAGEQNRLGLELLGIEREARRLRNRLESISRAIPPQEDGWQH